MGFYSEFAEYYEAVFPYRDEVYSFLKSRLPSDARRVLDAGCGTGHYCGRLAADGVQVMGIDLDPRMIDVARRTYPTPTFQCRNMTEVGALPSPFDFVFCIGNVAPHLTQDQFARFLADLHKILRPGGVWVVQTVNWDYVLAHGSYSFAPKRLGAGTAVFLRTYRDVSESRVRFVTRLADGERTLFEGDVWLYPLRAEVCMRLHRDCGFESVEHVADFKRTPFTAAADTGSVLVFRKP